MATFNRSFILHLFLQGFGAILFMFLALLSLDLVRANTLIWAAGASSLASSCFIIFGSPKSDVARPYRIFFGYLIAIVCGHLIRMAMDHFCLVMSCHPYEIHIYEAAAVLSMGLSFFAMLFLRSSHPPAAGLAVVMVLDITNVKAMIVIGAAAILLVLIQVIFGKSMKNLA